jgi:hypothetical protein
MVLAMGRAPAIKAAKQMMPDGPAVTVTAPMRMAAAAGSSRRVAIARSTEHHVNKTPAATTGSGRKPLLNGNQKAKKTKAPVHSGSEERRAATPTRGATSRLSSHHVSKPAASAGRRIQTLAVETCVIAARKS